MISEKMRR